MCALKNGENKMYSDFHLHSRFSGDSSEEPENIVKRAIELGMKSFCITDHQDLDYPFIPGVTIQPIFEVDPEEYFKVWQNLKDKYSSQIEIMIGLEAGIEPHTYEDQLERTKPVPFDFIINSCHVVTRKLCYFPDFFAEYGTQEGVRKYLECVYYNITHFTNYSVIGHIDFLLRFAPEKEKYRPEDNLDITEKILKKCIYDGKGIEVNTAGYRKGLNGPNPGRIILDQYKKLGGDVITIGSDAHISNDIGSNFDETGKLLKDIGFKYYCTFKERKPYFHRLQT